MLYIVTHVAYILHFGFISFIRFKIKVIIDDYYAWKGSRTATDEFLKINKDKVRIIDTKITMVFKKLIKSFMNSFINYIGFADTQFRYT